ncbi:hypothetical protein AXW83_06125 [Bosea sp. PAMC 26642]|nr:hypothetical protein AXW83_06125 [Bosea sp. PAMC 26642]
MELHVSVLMFWKTIPILIAQFLRRPGQVSHPIPVRFVSSRVGGANAFPGGGAGAPARTDLENRLDAIQALLISDLNTMVRALAAVVRNSHKQAPKPTQVPDLDAVLHGVWLGPSDSQTLLRKGNVLAATRDHTWDDQYRGHLPTAKAVHFQATGNVAGLKAMIESQRRAIALVGKARNAAQLIASGMRKVFNQAQKGNRPADETIARHVLDGLPKLSIMEMTEFSFVSGVNAADIWPFVHGEPAKIDYRRVFDLAVFAGCLARGEPTILRWDLVRYYIAHRATPNIRNRRKRALYPNTARVHKAIEWTLARVDHAYNIHTFTGQLVLSGQPGTHKIFRVAPCGA